MMSMLIGLVAMLIAFITVAFFLKAKHSLTMSGIAGLITGFMLGIFVAILPGFTHYFGPAEIPDPVIQVAGIAMRLSLLYPLILGVVGLIAGVFLGSRRKNNS
jgi:hypothetical protein